MKQVIHIGANKTASTLLQKKLFTQHRSINYNGEEGDYQPKASSILHSLINLDDSFYSEQLARDLLVPKHEGHKQVNLFSSEDIMNSCVPTNCARRLKKLMPEAEVVMVIRNQLTTWPSWYANHGAFLKKVPKRYWKSYVSFKEWLDYCFSFPEETPVEAMNYYRFYSLFSEIFGEDKIKVILYENLVSNPELFYSEWASILNLPIEDIGENLLNSSERTRISQRYYLLQRFFGSYPKLVEIISNSLKPWIHSGERALIPLPEYYISRISNYYSNSNFLLQEKTGLELAAFKYPLSNKP